MDFDFTPEQQAFADEVDRFLDEHDDPEVFDLTRENMAQIVDTPERRAFMRTMGQRGWLGMTWPKEYGGSEGEGVYEYLLNERLAGRGGPQIGKGVGIIGKTLIAHGNDFLKQKFLPMILNNDVEFAVGYSEPNAGSDAASMRLKGRARRARRQDRLGCSTVRRPGRRRRTSPSGTGLGTRTDPNDKHRGITLMLVPLDQPGVEIRAIWTMGDERTNEVFIDDVFVPDEYVVGEGRPRLPVHLAGARPRALHDVHDLADAAAARPALRLRPHDDARRQAAARRPRDPAAPRAADDRDGGRAGARPAGRRRVDEDREDSGGAPPTVESSQYKLYATGLSQRIADAAMDIAGPGSQLRVKTKDAPMEGRSESTYRYTVIDTIGGGASEIQKNVIARRGLGLPKNF